MSILITAEIARKAVEIINNYHTATAAILYGGEISPEGWRMAIDLGLIDPSSPPTAIAQQVFTMGSFLSHLDHAQWNDRYGSSVDDLLAEIARNPIPMTVGELKTAEFASRSAANYLVGLGNKAGATLGSSLIEADKALDKRLRDTVKDVVAAKFGDNAAAKRMKQRGVDKGLSDDFFDGEFRSTIKRMVSDMGHATEDWSRDWDRIAQTENQRALNEGLRSSWEDQELDRAKATKEPVERIVVYKIPRPDACKNCIRLHLDGDVPRLFYLDELEGNGVNVGRKVADWQAVVGPVHPFCACAIVKLSRFIQLPHGWRSGQPAPSVVGPGGGLVFDKGKS